MSPPCVDIVIVTWNSMPHIDACIQSIQAQTYPYFKIVVVDSASSDETADHVCRCFPDVEVVRCDRNVGYRKGNRIGMGRGSASYVVVSNDDIEAEPEWLETLVAYMESHPNVGLASPLILLHSNPGLVNAAGNALHFTGMYSGRGEGHPRGDYSSPGSVSAVSGCSFIVRRDLLRTIGGFSTDFDACEMEWHASFEDVDLCWRARMAGYDVALVPASVVYHKYKRRPMSAVRFAAYEWGRYLVVLRNYKIKTLCALAPVLLLVEALMLLYTVRHGFRLLAVKCRIWGWLLSHIDAIGLMRAHVQPHRTVPDSTVMASMDPYLTFSMFSPTVQAVLNGVFRLYWRCLSPLLPD